MVCTIFFQSIHQVYYKSGVCQWCCFMLILMTTVNVNTVNLSRSGPIPTAYLTKHYSHSWTPPCYKTCLRLGLNSVCVCVCRHSTHSVYRCVSVHVSACNQGYTCVWLLYFIVKPPDFSWVSGKGCTISFFLVFPGRPCLCSCSLRSFLLTQDGVKFMLFIC